MAERSEHVLIAGDVEELGAIEMTLSLLGSDAYGHVLIEASSAEEVVPIAAPDGMSITWLRRDLASGLRHGLAPRGELISRAVLAWSSEWMPDGRIPEDADIVLWIGDAGHACADRLCALLLHRIDRLHLHRPQRLRLPTD